MVDIMAGLFQFAFLLMLIFGFYAVLQVIILIREEREERDQWRDAKDVYDDWVANNITQRNSINSIDIPDHHDA
jgi:protein-S-isoprenylcysteine O-methyltransferase Ste14